jgi:hypothetical protein
MTETTEIPLNLFQGLNLHQGDSLRVLAETEKSFVVQIHHVDRTSPIVFKGRRGFPVVKGPAGTVVTGEDVARLEQVDDFRHVDA